MLLFVVISENDILTQISMNTESIWKNLYTYCVTLKAWFQWSQNLWRYQGAAAGRAAREDKISSLPLCPLIPLFQRYTSLHYTTFRWETLEIVDEFYPTTFGNF